MTRPEIDSVMDAVQSRMRQAVDLIGLDPDAAAKHPAVKQLVAKLKALILDDQVTWCAHLQTRDHIEASYWIPTAPTHLSCTGCTVAAVAIASIRQDTTCPVCGVITPMAVTRPALIAAGPVTIVASLCPACAGVQ